MLGRAFAIGTVGVVLGHPSPAVTEVYIEAGRTSADRAMAQVG
jgi:hypothetical protein